MTEPTIFVCRPGSINERDRASLRRAGVVVIEMDDPLQFKLIRATTELSSHDLFAAALDALASQPQLKGSDATTATLQRERFVQNMAALAAAEKDRRKAQEKA